MIEFNCKDTVLYRGSPVIVFGKRYGHATDPNVGRMYDIRLGTRTIRDVPEKDLQRLEESVE